MKEITLDKLTLGKSAVITGINDNSKCKCRMLDLGFTKNTKICPVRKSPAGDPVAYLIKGTLIALRGEDARSVNVIIN
ncbi:MAG: ferrous iron transport protein A [Ruminococcus sp.]